MVCTFGFGFGFAAAGFEDSDWPGAKPFGSAGGWSNVGVVNEFGIRFNGFDLAGITFMCGAFYITNMILIHILEPHIMSPAWALLIWLPLEISIDWSTDWVERSMLESQHQYIFKSSDNGVWREKS